MTEKSSLRFTERLKKHIFDLGMQSSLSAPIPAIVLASFAGKKEEIVLAFYDKDNIPAVDIFKIFESDGIEFLIPQIEAHDLLRGRILDVGDGNQLMDG